MEEALIYLFSGLFACWLWLRVVLFVFRSLFFLVVGALSERKVLKRRF